MMSMANRRLRMAADERGADLPGITDGTAIAVPGSPRPEASSVRNRPEREFPELAGRVRVPVHCPLGEHGHVRRHDPEEIVRVSALFTRSPRVVLNLRPNTGHDIGVGHTALAYHLEVPAFAEECVVARTTGEFSGLTRQFDGGTVPPSGR